MQPVEVSPKLNNIWMTFPLLLFYSFEYALLWKNWQKCWISRTNLIYNLIKNDFYGCCQLSVSIDGFTFIMPIWRHFHLFKTSIFSWREMNFNSKWSRPVILSDKIKKWKTKTLSFIFEECILIVSVQISYCVQTGKPRHFLT